jgi:hypothetical protein
MIIWRWREEQVHMPPMFDELQRSVRAVLSEPWNALAGVAFICLAMAAIQYDETIAPQVERISDGWSNAATGVSRKLTSFTL